MINKYSNTPMYSQLKDIILRKIRTGEYAEGAKIPSEEELCEAYGISRPTVRQAVNELSSTGILFREKGKGTFVSKRSSVIGIRKFSGFHGSVLAESSYAGRERQQIKKVTFKDNPQLSDMFQGMLQDSVFACSEYLQKNAEDDNERFRNLPYARILSYIPLSIFPDIIDGITGNKPMIEVLKGKYPYLPHIAKSSLCIASAGYEDSGKLLVQPGQPLIKVTSIIYSKTGQVVEAVVSLYRSDKCRLMFENTMH